MYDVCVHCTCVCVWWSISVGVCGVYAVLCVWCGVCICVQVSVYVVWWFQCVRGLVRGV